MPQSKIIRIVFQNLGHGALKDGDGNPEDRWPAITERIASIGAPVDVVALNECADWNLYGHKQLGRAMRDLDMDALPLPQSKSGYRPGLLYRPETMGRWLRWNDDFWFNTTHGAGVATFDVGLPKPLAILPLHLDPHSADNALVEAKLLATRGMRYGPFGMLIGDFNYPPAFGPKPLFDQMRPYNLAARTLLTSPDDASAPVPDRRVAWMVERCGYVDVAWHLYEQTKDEELLLPTGTDDRIDRMYVTRPLAPAIVSYRRLTEPAGASDHHGFVVELDLAKADVDGLWDYR